MGRGTLSKENGKAKKKLSNYFRFMKTIIILLVQHKRKGESSFLSLSLFSDHFYFLLFRINGSINAVASIQKKGFWLFFLFSLNNNNNEIQRSEKNFKQFSRGELFSAFVYVWLFAFIIQSSIKSRVIVRFSICSFSSFPRPLTFHETI